jgi:hypothetical protein
MAKKIKSNHPQKTKGTKDEASSPNKEQAKEVLELGQTEIPPDILNAIPKNIPKEKVESLLIAVGRRIKYSSLENV